MKRQISRRRWISARASGRRWNSPPDRIATGGSPSRSRPTAAGAASISLAEEIEAEVAPVRDRPFIVFHDGYRYCEDRFGLTAAGSAVVSSERTPGVRRIRELRQKVAELGVVCLIDEPHFDRRLINTVIEGTDVRSGTVDPMGATVDSGPDLYFMLIRNMSGAFRDCLAPPD